MLINVWMRQKHKPNRKSLFIDSFFSFLLRSCSKPSTDDMFNACFVLYLIYEYFNFIDYSEFDAGNTHIGVPIL